MSQRGRFLTFEGGEGSGKSTVSAHIARWLQKRGYEVVLTREPGGSAFGNMVRKWLLDPECKTPIGQQAEFLLFLAARAQHIEELIAPAVAAGKIVLCDRFNDSSVAYQGVARGLGFKYTRLLCSMVCEHIQPEMTFLLDIDPEIGLHRAKGTAKAEAAAGLHDKMEAEALHFHQQVRQGFQTLAAIEPERIHVIDASQTLPTVCNAIETLIETKW